MDSREYQQLMFNLLGGRDYDSFENDELDCLKRKIGYALYGHPLHEAGYDEKQTKAIEDIFKTIHKESDEFSKHMNRVVISFVYNCVEPTEKMRKKRENIEIQLFPVFILRKCKYSPTSCRVVVDHTGRVYQSWEAYLNKNTLPKCIMVLPKDGRYDCDETGQVLLEKIPSPACGVRAKILKSTDLASTGIGLASTGVVIAASIPAVTILGPVALCSAGIAGLGVGVYTMGRNLGTLYDRSKHKESINLSNSSARAAYFNLVASTMSFVGIGTNVAVTQLASRGVTIGKKTSMVMTTLRAFNIGTSGLAAVNSGYDVLHPVLTEKKAPSLLNLVQLSSSLLFFSHAVYSFKPTEVVLEETQERIVKKIRENLSGNKHRKAFEKLQLGAIKRNHGNILKGNAEIIAKIRKFSSKNQLIELLTGEDPKLNKLGFRSSPSGGFNWNGIPVDPTGFSSTKTESLFAFLRNNTGTLKTLESVNEIKDSLKFTFDMLSLNVNGVSKLANYFLGFTLGISKPILHFLRKFVEEYLKNNTSILECLDEFFPKTEEKCLQIINSATGFIYEEAKKLDSLFNSNGNHQNEMFENLFNEVRNLDEIGRFKRFLEFICIDFHRNVLTGSSLPSYFANFITEQALLYTEKKKRKFARKNTERQVERIKCRNCSGLRYIVISER